MATTNRPASVDLETRRYYEIADDESLDYQAKMEGYRKLADAHFDTDRYWEFCEQHLAHLPEAVLEWVDSDGFDKILLDTVRSTYPAHEHEKFLAHFRGLVGLWVKDQQNLAARR